MLHNPHCNLPLNNPCDVSQLQKCCKCYATKMTVKGPKGRIPNNPDI